MKIFICCACLLIIARPVVPNTDPWIDALPFDYPCKDALVNEYLEKANAMLYSEEEGYVCDFEHANYRLATTLFLGNLRKQGWLEDNIAQLRARMQANENHYKIHRSFPP